MKKMMSLALALVMCLSLCIPAFASDFSVSHAEKYAHLVECGIPEYVLDVQDEFSINSMYEESLTNYIALASFNQSQGLDDVNDSGISPAAVSDGSFGMDTTVLAVYASDRVTFLYYAVYTKYEWTSAPFQHLTDGITVNWDGNLLTYISGSFYYAPSYKTAYTSWTDDTKNATTTLDNALQGGVGVTFDLEKTATLLLRGTFFIKLEKRNAQSGGNRTTINSNYAHTTTSVAASSLTIGTSGVSTTFTGTQSYQNSASTATVTIP